MNNPEDNTNVTMKEIYQHIIWQNKSHREWTVWCFFVLLAILIELTFLIFKK